MFNSRLINTKVAGGGGGCTDIVDNYDPFGDSSGVALYQLNGNANDVSGNYNGTSVTDITWGGTGIFGTSASFNGSSSYFLTGINPSGFSAISFSSWVYWDGTAIFNIFGGTNTGGTRNSNKHWHGTDGSAIRIDYISGSGQFYRTTDMSNFNIGWVNIVITDNNTANSDSAKLYVNGIQNTGFSVLIQSYTPTTNTNLNIGRTLLNNGTTSYTDAEFDQMRVFNRVLDPLEVEALYKEELCICDGTVDTLDILGDGSCIATYPLDGNANDLSGNYSGTPTDVSYGVGEFDLAGVFNGLQTSSASYIDISSSTTSTTSTVSFWMNTTTKDSNTGNLFDAGGGSSVNKGFVISRTPTDGYLRVNFTHGISGQNQTFTGTTNICDGNWHFICLVMSSDNTFVCYLDGLSHLSGTRIYWTSGDLHNLPNNRFGTNAAFLGASSYKGSIDQVRIFNKALNSTEVTTLYNETACTKVTRTAGVTQILGDSSCVAYYKLDGTAADETGTYNGTFTSPDYRNGEFDLAANFNGINGEIALSNAGTTNLNLDGDFSISIWVKPLGVNAQGIYQFIYGSGVKEFGITYDPVVQRGGAYFWTGSAVASVGGDIPLSNWSNIVFSRSKTTGMKFYINNSLVDSDSFTGNGAAISSAYDALGQWGRPSIDRYFKGQLDNVRFFNKAVSASEVTTLYNEGI